MRFNLTLLLLWLAMTSYGQSAPITIDGLFDDWDASLATFNDVPETIAGIDILGFQVTNDDRYLYVHLMLDTEIDLTDNIIPQNLSMYIDVDTDGGTGFPVQPGFGSELGIQFDNLFAYYDVVPSSTVNFYDFGFHPAPTVSSAEFEFAIERNAIPDGINPLFPESTIRITFRELNDGDECPNDNTFFEYTFDETAVPDITPIPIDLQNPDDLRITCYNMLGNGVENGTRQPAFERIVKALDPHILGWSEAGNVSIASMKNLMDIWIPLGTPDGWYLAKDEDLITCSRYPILQEWSSLWRQFPVLIDLPEPYVSDLLFVNAHLSCCGADGNRQDQVDEFVSFWRDAKTSGGIIDLPANTPMVYGGDLNLVGFAQQLNTLVTGDIQDEATYGADEPMDWDGSELTDQQCRHIEARMTYTWSDDGQSYPPGRLDFQIFTNAVMEANASFSLRTTELDPAILSASGLLAGDTYLASDHLPVTVDYSIMQLADSDDDGVPDDFDNCIDNPNPSQADWNENGIGDACEDSDGDGLSDEAELTIFGSNPSLDDTDQDGLTDDLEVNVVGTNPTMQDTDLDGLSDGLEWNYSPEYDPLSEDSDNDGCLDADAFHLLCGDIGGCPGDLDNNGSVDTNDLLTLLSGFGTFCD